MKVFKWMSGIILLLGATYLFGPKVDIGPIDKTLPDLTSDLNDLEEIINRQESSNTQIKPDNKARIIWFDSIPKKTEYSMVYLHGFSASQKEGDPIHKNLAKKFGCNLYLPRLTGHGIDEEKPMLTLTANQLIESAKEAIAVGMKIGEKVILLTTSTGGTYGLYLAENQPDIAAIVLYSPNIDLYNSSSFLLAKPWGLQMAKLVKGSDYNEWPLDSVSANYWTNKYHLEVLTELRALINETMTPETFKAVTQPVFLGYFYKNDSIQDNTVSVPAMLAMYDQLGTPANFKRKVSFPEAGHHVIGSSLTSKDVSNVEEETVRFLKEIVGMNTIEN